MLKDAYELNFWMSNCPDGFNSELASVDKMCGPIGEDGAKV